MDAVNSDHLEKVGIQESRSRSRRILQDSRTQAIIDSGIDTSGMTEDEIEHVGKGIMERNSRSRVTQYYHDLAASSGIELNLTELEKEKLGKKIHEENSQKRVAEYYIGLANEEGLVHGTEDELVEAGKNVHRERSKDRLREYYVDLGTKTAE